MYLLSTASLQKQEWQKLLNPLYEFCVPNPHHRNAFLLMAHPCHPQIVFWALAPLCHTESRQSYPQVVHPTATAQSQGMTGMGGSLPQGDTIVGVQLVLQHPSWNQGIWGLSAQMPPLLSSLPYPILHPPHPYWLLLRALPCSEILSSGSAFSRTQIETIR